MVLHVYHAALEDKEFEFTIDIDLDSPNGFNVAVSAAVSEASSTMLAQVRPVKCCSCGVEEAVQLLHHPMLFNQCVPPRVEDMPQPVCGSSQCFRAAHESMVDVIKTCAPECNEKIMCFNCHLSRNYKLMQCSRCKVAKYCDAECQKQHWPSHKKVCQPPKK